MITPARDFADDKDGSTRRQLIGQRDLQSLPGQLWIGGASKRIVIFQFFLDTRRLRPELVKFIPGRLISVTSHDAENRAAKIWRKRCRIGEVNLKTIATIRN